LGDPALPSFCPNCGAPREDDAAFCARCGRNFTEEFKGTPIDQIEDASEVFLRLRASIGDRYAIERELGKGGMATVYLARDIKHDREVAIKVLHPELSASIGADRFEREIRLAAKLQHPHILGLYDSGSADGLLYYVMPFVRGEALRDRLDREGMLPVEDALRITLEVCSALHYAHEQGIVHRDIKPENILLSGEHSLVADFGIARAANDASGQKLTQTGMAVGTPVYMAPEQSTGDPVGPTADIYSLGCMLYEMLAGEPPFTGPNAMAIMAKHLMEQVPSVRVLRGTVPVEVEEAIFHALAKTAVDRPKTAQAFGEMLGATQRDSSGRRAIRPTSANRASVAVPRGSQMVRGSQMIPRQTISAQPVFTLDESGELVEIEQVPWWKRPATLLVAALVLALGGTAGYFAMNQPKAAGATDPTLRRVAVLYFDSPDSTLRSAADGITEGLIRTLSRVNAITTISQSGSESVRGVTSTDSIVKVLSAGFLVRGSLRPEGERVAINYRLETRNGSSAGDGSLTVARDSLLLVQDSIASLAGDLIRSQLGVELEVRAQRAATSSNAAWLAVQDGLALQRRAAGLDTVAAWPVYAAADSAFARAEELDRRWVEPISRRASLAYLRSRRVARTSTAVRPWVTAGLAHADRALALDAEDASALAIRGVLRYFGLISGMYDDAEAAAAMTTLQQDLESAVRLDSRQAEAWRTLAFAYNQIPGKGPQDEMVAALRALEADEFQANALSVRSLLVTSAYDAGDFDAADRYCRDLETRYPGLERTIRCRLYLQSVPGLESYDIARSWRLADSLGHAPDSRDTTLSRLTGEVFTAMTIARASVQQRSAALADSARQVARRAEGDAMIDKPRELIYFASVVSVILGDQPEWERRLTAYIAVNPKLRGDALRKDPGWWFKAIAETPQWQRLVGSGP
jgi:serine/threonine protein kinase